MTIKLSLPDLPPAVLQHLCGSGNRVLKRVEDYFGVRLLGRPGDWHIEGEAAEAAASALKRLAEAAAKGDIDHVHLEGILRDRAGPRPEEGPLLLAGRRRVQGKTEHQRRYLKAMQEKVLTLAVGPAGTGKTYLAVAAAVVALRTHEVERIILTRPAVEAGEKLGFLPGDMQQKVDPYLRPLFDALTDMLGVEGMNALMEAGKIEIAPLAYMRGRTINDAFMILDEAQNTTREQMKMFLTRLGFASKMVITGDVTQVDLAHKQQSGLIHALDVLADVEQVAICRLDGRDVVRHPLVERIVEAYARAEGEHGH